MKIQIQDLSSNGEVFVHRLSWKERCEKQLGQINKMIEGINKELKSI